LPDDPLIGELAAPRVRFYPTITQEEFTPRGRITSLIETGQLFMICGSIGLNKDMKNICQKFGLTEGSNSRPGTFVMEKAFVG